MAKRVVSYAFDTAILMCETRVICFTNSMYSIYKENFAVLLANAVAQPASTRDEVRPGEDEVVPLLQEARFRG